MAADNIVPSFQDSETVPFTYFDITLGHGILAGTVQIELAARKIAPTTDGGVKAVMVPTARLRCSPAAAQQLRDALNSALKMIDDIHTGTSAVTGRLN